MIKLDPFQTIKRFNCGKSVYFFLLGADGLGRVADVAKLGSLNTLTRVGLVRPTGFQGEGKHFVSTGTNLFVIEKDGTGNIVFTPVSISLPAGFSINAGPYFSNGHLCYSLISVGGILRIIAFDLSDYSTSASFVYTEPYGNPYGVNSNNLRIEIHKPSNKLMVSINRGGSDPSYIRQYSLSGSLSNSIEVDPVGLGLNIRLSKDGTNLFCYRSSYAFISKDTGTGFTILAAANVPDLVTSAVWSPTDNNTLAFIISSFSFTGDEGLYLYDSALDTNSRYWNRVHLQDAKWSTDGKLFSARIADTFNGIAPNVVIADLIGTPLKFYIGHLNYNSVSSGFWGEI